MDEIFRKLLGCHSTPGDEGEVRAVLESVWRAAGWSVTRHGDYAVSAGHPAAGADKPVLLICAHMDSPGYSVDRVCGVACDKPGRVRFGVTELGSPEFGGAAVPAVLKTRAGTFQGMIVKLASGAEEPDLAFEMEATLAAGAGVRPGDRICFTPSADESGTLLRAPFMDNRAGCWMLARLAAEAPLWQANYRIILGAASAEEMGGTGASVLAAQIRPDLAVVLDTTYESEEQDVRLGGGPVLTLSDASVLLAPATRDRVIDLMARAQAPLQTEVYNFSGTDAKAFPRVGLSCPVLPLLLPTRGNHSPCEVADARDLEAWLTAIRVLAENF